MTWWSALKRARLIYTSLNVDERELVAYVCVKDPAEAEHGIEVVVGPAAGRAGITCSDSHPAGFDVRRALRLVRELRRGLGGLA
jgi:hypothetical protein